MREHKGLKIVVTKTEMKNDNDEDVLQIHYILDGRGKEKTNVISNINDLNEEEKVVFTKFFMIIERLLISNNSNKTIGI